MTLADAQKTMRVHAIINCQAGSALGLRSDELARETVAAFQAEGHEITVDIAEPDKIAEKIDAAVLSAPEVLIAGGGDGTVQSVARRVLGTEIAVGILPLGTVNRLARDLRIPLYPASALVTLARGVIRDIDVADVNGRIFLCNSLLGLPPRISEERQHLRGRTLGARLGGYFRLLRTILSAHRRIALSIDDEKSTRRVRVLSLAVSNNLYRHEPALVFTRERLDGGVLGVYMAKARSGFGLLWVLARAALGIWSGDSRLESISAERVTISSHRKSVRLSNDGEVETLETPLHYNIRTKALKVLVPPNSSS